jgi:hypothetical protein
MNEVISLFRESKSASGTPTRRKVSDSLTLYLELEFDCKIAVFFLSNSFSLLLQFLGDLSVGQDQQMGPFYGKNSSRIIKCCSIENSIYTYLSSFLIIYFY